MPRISILKHHKVLLDTHVWLWLMTGASELSSSFRKAVDRCCSYEGVLISAISVWEVGMLVEKKRIELDRDCLEWVEEALEKSGVKLLPISPRIAIQSSRLPGDVHGDPADRLLIATAYEHNAVLVTCDRKLLEYGQGRYISVHNPER